MSPLVITHVDAANLDSILDDLADILHATVLAGGSVNFILPFSLDDSRDFWREKMFPIIRSGGRLLLIAQSQERIVGTVQLLFDMPQNQVHRCEVSKLLVHPDFRNRGIARSLMTELENHAVQRNRSLICLDTRTGDAAEPLYLSLGYKVVGTIPNFCRATDCDRMDSTTYMYKLL
ncbi:MAG: GNAT family N-acetyltransferase [Alphaproteobacteria bacterium]|nr:GNAT family N-acetyltransferase [Alphaproteobacteria bacterium]